MHTDTMKVSFGVLVICHTGKSLAISRSQPRMPAKLQPIEQNQTTHHMAYSEGFSSFSSLSSKSATGKERATAVPSGPPE